MLKKSLKKLAGCLAIELLWASGAFAADYYYKAGFAASGQAKALALEDRKGHRAVVLTTAFDAPLSVGDTIAAQAIKEYGLERASLVVYSVASGPAAPADARTAIGAALGNLKAAMLVYGNGRLTVSSYDGRCLVAVSAEASLDPCTTPVGDLLGGYIRAALQVVDLSEGLQTRDAVPHSAVVQTLAIGPIVLFLGPSNVVQAGKKIILAATPAVETDTRLDVAAGQVFLRVGGRPH
jgi:hypothetical protein